MYENEGKEKTPSTSDNEEEKNEEAVSVCNGILKIY